MSSQEIRRAVQELIAGVLNRKKVAKKPEEIKEGVSLTRELGIDSLDILQICATVEKKYKVKIPEEDLKKMDDLGAILAAVKKYLPAQA